MLHVNYARASFPQCSRSALHLLPLSSTASRSGVSLPSFLSSLRRSTPLSVAFRPHDPLPTPSRSAMFAPLLDRRSFSARPRRYLALVRPRIGHRECQTVVSFPPSFLFGSSNFKIIDWSISALLPLLFLLFFLFLILTLKDHFRGLENDFNDETIDDCIVRSSWMSNHWFSSWIEASEKSSIDQSTLATFLFLFFLLSLAFLFSSTFFC